MKSLYPEVNVKKVGIVGAGRIGGALAEAVNCEVDEIVRSPHRKAFNHDFIILAVGPEKYSNFEAYCQSLAGMGEKIPTDTPIGIVAYIPSDKLTTLKRQAIGDCPVVRFLCTIAVAGKHPSKVYYLGEDSKRAYRYLRAVLPESNWADTSEEYYDREAAKLSAAGSICAAVRVIEAGLGSGPNPGNEGMVILEEAYKMIRTTMSPEEAVEKTTTPGGLTQQILDEFDISGAAKAIADTVGQTDED